MRKAVLAAAALMAGAAVAQTATPEIEGYRDWKRLRAEAHTAEEFRKLAEWCSTQVSLNRAKAAMYDLEWKHYYSNPTFRAEAKYPSREQQLKTLVAHYRELSKHWEDLGAEMRGKAEHLQAGSE
jgi:hypothetical protein